MAYLTYQTELLLLKKTPYIAGIDEAGRGPLAGPVVAAAVILDPQSIAMDNDSAWHANIRDSKKITEKKRPALARIIKEKALSFGIGQATHEEIDEINILQATFLAMRRAVEGLSLLPDIILVDGPKEIPNLLTEQKAIIDGDALVLSIAAASIIAKVERDSIMRTYHQQYPQYGFDKHKGYGTALHQAMVKQNGPCPIHRKTFLRKQLTNDS